MDRTRRQARAPLWGLVITLVLLVGGCGQAPPALQVSIVSAVATSQTSVAVTFSGAVNDAAKLAENYVITGPAGVSLGVIAAYPGEDGITVNLATEPQQLVKYQLSVKNVALGAATAGGTLQAQGGFGGSGEVAPIVASAIALSNTEVLVTFADPTSAKLQEMGDGAINIAYYEIAEPSLEILGAAFARRRTSGRVAGALPPRRPHHRPPDGRARQGR